MENLSVDISVEPSVETLAYIKAKGAKGSSLYLQYRPSLEDLYKVKNFLTKLIEERKPLRPTTLIYLQESITSKIRRKVSIKKKYPRS